jgi:hypothetical protein
MEWSEKYVERRGATFPEISGHFGGIEARGNGVLLEKPESVIVSIDYKKRPGRTQETPSFVRLTRA